MKKILTGSQRSTLNGRQPKTPIGSGNNAHITTDGTNLMIKNLDTVAELGDDFETLAINKRTRKVVKSPGGAGGSSMMNYKGDWAISVDPQDSRCLLGPLPANPEQGDSWTLKTSGTFHAKTSFKFTHGNYPDELRDVAFVPGDILFFDYDSTWRVIYAGNPAFPRGTINMHLINPLNGDLLSIPASGSLSFAFNYTGGFQFINTFGDPRASVVNGTLYNAYEIMYGYEANQFPRQPRQLPNIKVRSAGGTSGNLWLDNLTDQELVAGTEALPSTIILKQVLHTP